MVCLLGVKNVGSSFFKLMSIFLVTRFVLKTIVFKLSLIDTFNR